MCVGGCCRTDPATIASIRARLLPALPEASERAHAPVDPSSSIRPLDWEPHMRYLDRRPEASRLAPTVARVEHRGRCHCGAVRFSVFASSAIVCWDCNCSVCLMKRNVHFVVPKDDVVLDEGHGFENLSCYTFGTHVARHLFCRYCGVVPFYQPRSNPDGYAVTVHCLEAGTVTSIEVRTFDGENWEDFIEGSGIRAFSQKQANA
jgi:hypothetical protein